MAKKQNIFFQDGSKHPGTMRDPFARAMEWIS